jgi:hypothetical protein
MTSEKWSWVPGLVAVGGALLGVLWTLFCGALWFNHPIAVLFGGMALIATLTFPPLHWKD